MFLREHWVSKMYRNCAARFAAPLFLYFVNPQLHCGLEKNLASFTGFDVCSPKR